MAQTEQADRTAQQGGTKTLRYREALNEALREEMERDAPDVAHELAEAGAAYANVGDAQERRRQKKDEESAEDGDG